MFQSYAPDKKSGRTDKAATIFFGEHNETRRRYKKALK
jgi:hypothetical protein